MLGKIGIRSVNNPRTKAFESLIVAGIIIRIAANINIKYILKLFMKAYCPAKLRRPNPIKKGMVPNTTKPMISLSLL
jgi:hypothetical protein